MLGSREERLTVCRSRQAFAPGPISWGTVGQMGSEMEPPVLLVEMDVHLHRSLSSESARVKFEGMVCRLMVRLGRELGEQAGRI